MTRIPVFDIDASRGKAACYFIDSADPTDERPLLNPRAYLSDVKFHSDFDYPKIISDTTVSVTLPAIGRGGGRVAQYQLFAHGQAGIPFCLGAFQGGLLTSEWLPVSSSTPVAGLNVAGYTTFNGVSVPQHEGFGGQMISLGATATHVVLQEVSATQYYYSGGRPAITLSIRVLVTDELL